MMTTLQIYAISHKKLTKNISDRKNVTRHFFIRKQVSTSSATQMQRTIDAYLNATVNKLFPGVLRFCFKGFISSKYCTNGNIN